MRSFLVALAGLMLFATGAAQAKIAITVDKDAQMMTVAVDGVARYQWPVSSGNPSHETPNGSFRTFRMEADHFSKEFDDAPMPHSIFFTREGHAIHGTESEGQLGFAGFPWLRAAVARQRLDAIRAGRKARRAQHHRDADRFVADRARAQSARPRQYRRRAPRPRRCRRAAISYNAAGDPVVLTPRQPRQAQYPQERPDDGYIYPADGSQDGTRYPAPPRAGRRLYDAQAYPQPQQQYYGNAPQAYAPQVYAPRPNYQPRGLFTYPD